MGESKIEIRPFDFFMVLIILIYIFWQFIMYRNDHPDKGQCYYVTDDPSQVFCSPEPSNEGAER